jgi:hypothetical protein
LQRDVERARQLVGIVVDDVGEDPALRGLADVGWIARIQECNHRATGLAHDLSDQLERILADIDLARDDVVVEMSHDLREHRKAVALLVRDQHAQAARRTGSRRDRRRLALLRSGVHEALRSAVNVTPPGRAAPP